jgi:hypothetical protein
LRLPLMRRPWIVDAAQNAAIDEVSRRLLDLAITFFTAGHSGRFAPVLQ